MITTIQLPDDLAKKFKELCSRKKVSMSAVITAYIVKFIKTAKK